MTKKTCGVVPHFRSAKTLAEHIAAAKLGVVDPREWREEWAERWVLYADLLAFASRALRSETVVLNNILRFARASFLVAEQFPSVAVRRFSDATFAIAETLHQALAFGIALSHACLAFNAEYLSRGVKPFFIHLIVPRITLAYGRVLLLPPDTKDDPRFNGIDPGQVIAGSAVVRAYQLERLSAGGLLTIDADAALQLRKYKLRGDNSRVLNGLRRWVDDLGDNEAMEYGQVFFHRRQVCDVPWLLLRPLQNDHGSLWAAQREDADSAIATFFRIWRANLGEFYSPQNSDIPLEASKHAQAAIRHGVQCHHAAHGRRKPKYQSFLELV